ncbi:sphingomyelin phosphodiesterase 5-like [Pollicipes pollicipes]|uniref:sphingomyelin phosphodiesterase 5-like n=1 Tax=Pollicipes pollicipes TaxID=41117 RepID=UPI0018852FC6|nr:sphingomyelin phosphodiesterase 5-like [Pollicipes pollicipes]
MTLGAGRYQSSLPGLLDNIAFVLTYPWLTIASLFLSCYQSTPWEVQHPQSKLTHYFVYGPVLGLLALAFAPLGLLGCILHIFLCHAFVCNKYIHMTVPKKLEANGFDVGGPDTGLANLLPSRKFTFCSANLLLAPECVGRFNKNKFVYTRGPEVARRLLWQQSLCENSASLSKEDHVSVVFPEVDFFCLQEVWERVWALFLIKELMQKYPHFLYDIGENKLGVNGCMAGSGLFFASKYPILKATFETFNCRKGWAKCISYGVLCVKVDVGAPRQNRVGYIANLHTQAYQDQEPIIYQELQQAHTAFERFRQETLGSDEESVFQMMCGDFNYDNMSPGDAMNQSHPMFEDYEDFCRVGPGTDKPWTVGTEMRQVMMFDDRLNSPRSFRRILIDDVERRRFVLDADVVSQTLELARSPPPA